MLVTDGNGTPLANHIESASPSEIKLLDATLGNISVGRTGRRGRPRKKPDRLIADRGYDSNDVRESLMKKGIQPIIPARKNNGIATHQDGRNLRRYSRRWMVERAFAWLQNFRRVTVRWERFDYMYAGFVNLACAFLLLRKVMQ